MPWEKSTARMGAVDAVDGRRFAERQGHVAGAAAEVENTCFRPREDLAEGACGAPPPGAINAARKDVIQDVVAVGDVVEHLLHVGGGGLRVGLRGRRQGVLQRQNPG